MQLNDNTRKSAVTILVDGHAGVKVDTVGDGEADTTYDPADIKRLTFGDEPLAYKRARIDFRNGLYAKALKLFEKAREAKKPRSFWLVQHTNYFMGECRRRLAEKNKSLLPTAIRAYKRVLEKSRGARRAPAAIRGIGLCLLAEGKTGAAREELKKLVDGRYYGDVWAMRGKLLMARVLCLEKKPKEALELCNEVLASPAAAKRKELLGEARLARAQTYLDAGDYKKAFEAFTKIADEAKERDYEVKARAYNAIGDALLGRNQAKEARLAYLRVWVLYPKAADELPRALYGASRCFTILKQGNEARRLVKKLEEDYPDSVWTARARKELGG